MSIFDRLRSMFSREGEEAKIFFEELRQRTEDDLGRREAELTETPEEALARAEAAAQAGDDEFARLEGAIGSRLSKAEVTALTEPADEGEDLDMLDMTDFDRNDRDPLGMRTEAAAERSAAPATPQPPPDGDSAERHVGRSAR